MGAMELMNSLRGRTTHPSCNSRRWLDHFNGSTALFGIVAESRSSEHRPSDPATSTRKSSDLFSRETNEAALFKNYQNNYSLHEILAEFFDRFRETIPRTFTGLARRLAFLPP